MENKLTIALLGGTGELGSGMALMLAAADYPVVIGSRGKDRAEEAARGLSARLSKPVHGDDNRGAAGAADVVILCVPYSNHDSILHEIKPVMGGKLLVDVVVPLVPPKVSVVQLPATGSPAMVAQRILGPEVRVAAAFHNVAAKKLHGGERADCDVLVFADEREVRQQVIELASVVASRGIDGGALANAVAAEALTSVLIAINRRYKVPGAGIHITGLPPTEIQ